MNPMTLRFHNISKTFGYQKVLDRVSYAFGTGLYALHGSNGIGKSTLLSILAGILEPDAGEIEVAGHSLHSAPLEAKARLSYVPDKCPIYPFMTGCELLQFVARAKGTSICPDVEALVESFALGAYLNTRFGQMSLGTQKKTMLASAWIGQPSVMLMDEPSNGLDLATRDVLIARIRQMREKALILISTHDAEFAQSTGAEVLPFSKLHGPLMRSHECRRGRPAHERAAGHCCIAPENGAVE
ncbi:ABC transporter ATP-binding protein [Verminephrobacter aporrectodeae]|uniref:ABC transporter ATP-binding protein n=1 Tax=Verminephrobacter aporrectodeae TaxID=1110389 RepID=UPI0022380A50|nr:ABC transporter ATP-binding protein [Verminephrobacter aporrectodeae]